MANRLRADSVDENEDRRKLALQLACDLHRHSSETDANSVLLTANQLFAFLKGEQK